MHWKNREFAELYNDYYPLIFGTIYTKVGDADETEDICQELFIKFYEKLETIENKRQWLYGAVRYQMMSYYRNKKSNIDIDKVFDDIALSFVNGFKDTRIIINDAIENMDNFKDEREKVLFNLIAIHRFSYREAGSQLGLSIKQVRYKYEKIVKRLKSYLADKGIKSLEDLI